MTVKNHIILQDQPLNKTINCPICGGQNHSFLRPIYDDRYGCPDPYQLVTCNGCGHVMTSPMLEESALGTLYSNYYPRKQVKSADLITEAAKVNLAWAKMRRWLAGTHNQGQYAVRPGQTMLDVGSGSGLSLLEAQVLGAKAYGIEADPNVRRIADELGLQVHIGSLHDHPFPDISFDLIVLNQVIEHIPAPGLAMEALKLRLKPNGRLLLVFPNRRSLWQRLSGARWINWHAPYHLHHFDAQGFRTLAKRHGFLVKGLMTITPNVWSILQLHVLFHPPVRGVQSPVWGDSSVNENTSNTSASSEEVIKIHKHRPGRLLRKSLKYAALMSLVVVNRLIDLTGMGDSILIELQIDLKK